MLIYSSLQINLPDSVTKRFAHSMSTYYISKERFWNIVTGGFSEINRSNKTAQPITVSNITVIIELGMIVSVCSLECVHSMTDKIMLHVCSIIIQYL